MNSEPKSREVVCFTIKHVSHDHQVAVLETYDARLMILSKGMIKQLPHPLTDWLIQFEPTLLVYPPGNWKRCISLHFNGHVCIIVFAHTYDVHHIHQTHNIKNMHTAHMSLYQCQHTSLCVSQYKKQSSIRISLSIGRF